MQVMMELPTTPRGVAAFLAGVAPVRRAGRSGRVAGALCRVGAVVSKYPGPGDYEERSKVCGMLCPWATSAEALTSRRDSIPASRPLRPAR